MGKRLSDDEKRVFSDQISLLKDENEQLTDRIEELLIVEAKNEALMELAATYIKAYEEIAFADAILAKDDADNCFFCGESDCQNECMDTKDGE